MTARQQKSALGATSARVGEARALAAAERRPDAPEDDDDGEAQARDRDPLEHPRAEHVLCSCARRGAPPAAPRARREGTRGTRDARGPMDALLGEFERHHERMIVRARERRAAVALTNLVDAGRVKTSVSEDDLLGKRLPRDEFQGDTNFRTLKALLKKVDERGMNAALINSSFTKTSSRRRRASCTAKTGACKAPHHAEARLGNPGEVLISTPRRFGKTFRSRSHARCWCLPPPD